MSLIDIPALADPYAQIKPEAWVAGLQKTRLVEHNVTVKRITSVKALVKAMEQQGRNPYDLAFVVMARHRLGEVQTTARDSSHLRNMMKQPRWSTEAEARRFFDEATKLVGDPPADDN